MPTTLLRRKQVPAAWAVLVISMALAGVLIIAIALLAWNSYRDAVDRTRVRASSSAQVVATHIEWLMAAGLQALEESDRAAGPAPFATPAGAVDEMRGHFSHLPRGISFSFVDSSGKTRLSSGASGDLAPADGIELSKLNDKQDWYVSALVQDSGMAAQHFLIAKRIVRNGQPLGAAVLRVPVEVMSNFWASLDLGPGSTVGLFRDDGWLVARYPPTSVPTNLRNYVLFTEYLKKEDNGTYDAVSPVDGISRIVGYCKVPNAPLIAIASISRGYALEKLWEQLRSLALFLIPLVIGLTALAFWVAKLLRRDELMRVSLSAAVEKNNLLMREIHHRTKNNLQSVASLIKLQPISEDAKSEMHARIAAMSAVHEQAYRSDLYADTDLKDYLTLLIGNIERGSGRGIRFAADIAGATIDRDLAQPLGLVVNEVISNALKHAFAGRGEGRIAISLRMIAADRAELVIHDDGGGHVPSDDDRGMGTRLVRAFAKQLGDDYDYTIEHGTRFAIRFAAKGSGRDGS